MKANNTYNVVIANEAHNFTATKYNTTLTGFECEAAHNAAKEALRDIAGELGYFNYKVIYSPTLDAWTLTNKKTQAIIMTAKIEEATETDTTPETSGTMNTETKVNTLTLSKCAYIFHWSNSTYYRGTREQIAHKAAVNRALKAIYKNPAKGVNIPYVMEGCRAYIELDGLKIDVCDTMLQSITGEYPNAEIVNGRTFKDLTPFYESFKPGTFTRFNESADGQQYFWGAKLKSMEFESFPSPDCLRYYRLHFRGNRLDLIVSNGKIYAAGGSNYAEISTGDVLRRLDAESKAAKVIITKFIEYIKA